MKNKLKSIFQKTGVVRLLKSLRLRIFLIVCLVGIIPILLMKMNILERYEEQSLIQRGRMLQNQSQNLADRMGTAVTNLNLDIGGFATEMEQLA